MMPSYRRYTMTSAERRETPDRAFEIKFIVDTEAGLRIRERVRELLAPDPNATGPSGDEYRISTIYFDTDELAVYQRMGSYGRAKFRIRRYGDGDCAFLERKLRTSSVLSKRRTPVPIGELSSLDRSAADWPGQWFGMRVRQRQLRPTAVVGYRRTARVGLTATGPVRATIDQELEGTRADAAAFGAKSRFPLLPGRTIVELKFRVAMPAIFRQVVEEFSLRPAKCSKYRLAVRAIFPEIAGASRPVMAQSPEAAQARDKGRPETITGSGTWQEHVFFSRPSLLD